MKKLIAITIACAALLGSAMTASAQNMNQGQNATANYGNASPANNRVNSHQQD